MKITKIRNVTIIAYLFFLVANIIYFYFFFVALPLPEMGEWEYYGIFSIPANFDHLKYMWFIKPLEEGESIGPISNTTGICYFYYYLRKIIHLDYVVLSFIVNNIFILFSYIILIKILEKGFLSTKYSFIFFFNPQMIYYSQLINKEAITLFFILLMTFLLMTKNRFIFFLIIPISMIFRLQHAIFALFLYLLFYAKSYRTGIIFIYLISAGCAALFANMQLKNELIEGSRFLSILYDLNRNYYIGNLVLAPARIIQFAYAQLMSFKSVLGTNGLINLYQLRDTIPIMIIFILCGSLFRVFMNINKYAQRGERFLFTPIIAFLFVLLIHPYTHPRYLFPINVLLIQMGLAHIDGINNKRTQTMRAKYLNNSLNSILPKGARS